MEARHLITSLRRASNRFLVSPLEAKQTQCTDDGSKVEENYSGRSESQFALYISLCVDQISYALRLCQVDPAALECPARKFSGLGRTESGYM
jgi:hypothetical protein